MVNMTGVSASINDTLDFEDLLQMNGDGGGAAAGQMPWQIKVLTIHRA